MTGITWGAFNDSINPVKLLSRKRKFLQQWAAGHRRMEPFSQSREKSQEDASDGEPIQAPIVQNLYEVHVWFWDSS